MPMTAESDTPETETTAPANDAATTDGVVSEGAAPAAKRRPRARTARPKLDAVSAAAVDLAREALVEVTEPGQVGEHLRVEASGERLVTHVFACEMPGYSGWVWNAVLARAPRAKQATVCETVLLPGDSALLAPDWEPWSERLKPSDVGADDLLPFQEADERLEEGYEQTDDADADRLAQWELGLGRPRVLSPVGREEAADRWFAGDFGPRPVSSRKRRGTVTATCSSCGFLTLMAGSLRTEFGVCTNEWSVADGRVVHLDYGCGSHSETGKEEIAQDSDPDEGVVVDEYRVDVDRSSDDAEGAPEPADGADATTEADAASHAETSAEADTPAETEAPAEAETAVAETEAAAVETESVAAQTASEVSHSDAS